MEGEIVSSFCIMRRQPRRWTTGIHHSLTLDDSDINYDYCSNTHCPSCAADKKHRMTSSPDGVLSVYRDVIQ